MKKTSKKKPDIYKGYDCPDCKRNVSSLYSVVAGKQNGKILIKQVCWVCSNDEKE